MSFLDRFLRVFRRSPMDEWLVPMKEGDTDARFRFELDFTTSDDEINRLLPNLAWHILNDAANSLGDSITLDLTQPAKHVRYIMDRPQGKFGLLLRFGIKPMGQKRITEFILARWKIHHDEARIQWAARGGLDTRMSWNTPTGIEYFSADGFHKMKAGSRP